MATNAQMVFDHAMDLMDERNETTGMTDTSDTKEYKQRTLGILNMLRGEVYRYSDTFRGSAVGFRPIVKRIEDFDEDIMLDDYICQTVLPYGLAAHLLIDENPTSANFFQTRYEELLRQAVLGMPSASEDIVDVYGPNGGIFPYNEFSMWG